MTLIHKDDVCFFEDLARATVGACTIPPGLKLKQSTDNRLPFSAVRPGGRDCYPAIWIQDFAMIFSGGFVAHEVGMEHLRLILQCQNGPPPRHLQKQAVIPPHAIPDHINLDASPVFYPGTYSSGDDQGGEPYGLYPPANNHYDVIWLADMLVRRTGDPSFLLSDINGRSIYERLKCAFHVPEADPATGLVCTAPERRAVGFIFCDSVYMTGHLLMASLLRRRAARHLAHFAGLVGRPQDAPAYRRQADLIAASILPVFARGPRYGGWLKAATGVSGQADVWGTAYALYSGALPEAGQTACREAIVRGIRNGTIEHEGAFRHVPLSQDASATTMWEKTHCAFNRYQNGAYWHMPAGWIVSAIREQHPDLAVAVMERFIRHMRAHDFRKGKNFGGPWECIGWDGKANQNPAFGPSITMPFRVLFPIGVETNS